jgi:stringent starvation protein B
MPSKEEVAKAILATTALRVHLDPRRTGVLVPDGFARDPNLVLEFGTNLYVPVPDLVVDEVGIRGTLTFGGVPFHCTVPWTAVFGLFDAEARGQVWKEDVPPDLPQTPVPDRHETECSFCKRHKTNVKCLIAGPGVSICDECVVDARATRSLFEIVRAFLFAEKDEAPLPPKKTDPYRDPSFTACSFCGHERSQMLVGATVRICRPCVRLSYDIAREGGYLR